LENASYPVITVIISEQEDGKMTERRELPKSTEKLWRDGHVFLLDCGDGYTHTHRYFIPLILSVKNV
jgi:hypothetical protein